MIKKVPRTLVIISGCLLGEPVRYDGKANWQANGDLQQLQHEGRLIPFCPEVAGGLTIPRLAAEISNGDGRDVVSRRAKVVNKAGQDVTAQFLLGAKKCLSVAQKHGAQIAILKENSPSCGVNFINDGTFSGKKRAGCGVATALLRKNNICVFSEEQVNLVFELLKK